MQIEPDTKIVQTHFGRQTSLKPCQVMRTFTSQAKGIQEFVVDGFNDLSDASQLSPQPVWPALPFAISFFSTPFYFTPNVCWYGYTKIAVLPFAIFQQK